MPKKQEVIDSIKKDTYSKHEVITLIQSVKPSNDIPNIFKKGDVYSCDDNFLKMRPHVIVKVINEIVVSMAFSSKIAEYTICEYKDRFFEGGFCKGFICHRINNVKDSYICKIENMKLFNRAIKLNKQFIIDNIK